MTGLDELTATAVAIALTETREPGSGARAANVPAIASPATVEDVAGKLDELLDALNAAGVMEPD